MQLEEALKPHDVFESDDELTHRLSVLSQLNDLVKQWVKVMFYNFISITIFYFIQYEKRLKYDNCLNNYHFNQSNFAHVLLISYHDFKKKSYISLCIGICFNFPLSLN